MGYYEHLKELLSPLGLYKLDSGAGMAELRAVGAALDGVYDALEELEREALPTRAAGYGLEAYEELMPFAPLAADSSGRGEALAALMRIDGMGFTPGALRSSIAGCGIGAEISESGPETLLVTIVNTRGVPEDFSLVKERIEQILPCHLEVEYRFIYTTWSELMALIPDWQELETLGLDWAGIEVCTGGE